MAIKYGKINIIHIFGKGNGCTSGGISENQDELTFAFGGDAAWKESDADLVLVENTTGPRNGEVVRDQAHLNEIYGKPNGSVCLVDRMARIHGEWAMCGGNFATDSGKPCKEIDLRFHISIHDRVEDKHGDYRHQ